MLFLLKKYPKCYIFTIGDRMKKLIVLLTTLIIVLTMIFVGYNETQKISVNLQNKKTGWNGQIDTTKGNARIFTNKTLFEKSIIDKIDLNLVEVPEIEIVGNSNTSITNDQKEISENNLLDQTTVTFNDCTADSELDDVITVTYKNAGTLNDKAIDMKLVYSNLHTSNTLTEDTEVKMTWTAYGTHDNQISETEWWLYHITHFNLKLYLNYTDTSEPIHFDNAYLTLFSENGSIDESTNKLTHSEASTSKIATNVYLYENTTINYNAELDYYGTKYPVYHGTTSGGTMLDGSNEIVYQFKNTNYLEIDKFIYSSTANTCGYHIHLYPYGLMLPENPQKLVNEEKIELDEDVIYTISQNFPKARTSNHFLSSLVFKDKLAEGFKYKELKVYNEKNEDITEKAGKINYENNILTYTYDTEYLKEINYNGQTYKYIITGTSTKELETSQLSNKAEFILNDLYTLESNTVISDIYSYIKVFYVDEEGNGLVEPDILQGNLYEEYITKAKEIKGYTLVKTPTNAKGKYGEENNSVIYVYSKVTNPTTSNNNIIVIMIYIIFGASIVYAYKGKKQKS